MKPVSGPKIFSVSGQKWEEKKLLGEGGFGYVYIVENLSTGKQAALKQMNCSGPTFEIAKKEVSILKTLQGHPNIVRFMMLEQVLFQKVATKLLY